MSKKENKRKQSIWQLITGVTILICMMVSGYISQNVEVIDETNQYYTENKTQDEKIVLDLSTIPEYISSPYVEINNNIPDFREEDYTTEAFEKYSEWDELGRSGVAYANICKEIMPKEERGEIGNIKDLSGWVQKRYDNLIKDKYLYNRCHLIG